MASAPLIIAVALTGQTSTLQANPSVPVSPTQIAADAARAVAAGAALVRLDARDHTGKPSLDPALYAAIISGVRETCPEVIISVTTAVGREASADERCAVLELGGDAKPDMAALTLGSFNTARAVSIHPPATIRRLAEEMHARGIRPELEVLDLGMLDTAAMLVEHGLLAPAPYVTILLGAVGTLGASAENLGACVRALPAGAVWAAGGTGRHQLPVNELAAAMGGHVRTGLADNLYTGADRHCATNTELVEAAAAAGRAVGRRPATPAQARALIGLPPAA